METLTPQQAEARAKTMLAYLRGINEKDYNITVLAQGASPQNPDNAHLEFTLTTSDIKSAPDGLKRILPVPQEVQKRARRYESTIILPAAKSTLMWYIKPVIGNHSQALTYGITLHAGGTETEWLKRQIEARKRVPQTA
ncbi:MAG: hypothetical protein UV59_C0040G0001 [Candidatus Gottesmanbacteria bacterium GW2011_GWA1_43_11]|uniref:Uncharacterized protein n=1 Tax=Candidatus Gottesmanbacteria bacterium GW2011_GWA1_43_11 TaxID=1618436 RepID=A0A0G1CDB7_9BACT|nr:MAG: hypothetical protein UV59_C0040G0001 [Candidatus Gottesmanbacteria bacterium GW2011_GWA1_43_11]